MPPPNPPRKVGNDGTVFKCPICKAILAGTGVATFPFCSNRCRLLDLNNWMTGGYTLARPIDPSDEIEKLPRNDPAAKSPPAPSDEP